MRIVIVDDHPVVRSGVEQVLSLEEDMEVVGTASSVEEGLEIILAQEPDIALVDLRMRDGGGLDLIRRARPRVPGCRFVILTAYGSLGEVSQASQEAVDGYILKEALPEELVSALRLVARGRRYYDPEVVDSIVKGEDDNLLDRLTARELEVLAILAQGMDNTAISEQLYISENTVRRHVSNILGKLRVENRVQAAYYALSRGVGGNPSG